MSSVDGKVDIEAEEIKIPVPWGHVSGKWWGPKNIQPIVTLHGRQDNAGSFDRLIPMISNEISFLCLDLPGHGYSSHLHKGQYYFVYYDGLMLLRRVARHFQWSKIKLLGHSLGGAIGFLYAASYPDEVDLLISLDIASPTVKTISKCVTLTKDNVDKYLKYEQHTNDSAPVYDYAEMVDIVMDAYAGSITRESAQVLMRRGTQPAAIPGKHVFSRDPRLKVSLLGMLSMDLTSEYARQIKCRYLNIRAKPGLKFDHPEHYQEILDIIKNNAEKFEYHEVEGSHHVHLNEPEKVAPIIKNFLGIPA
ncbi:probable serine hydrolase isoform X4 [Microplitis demolitor]|uniref:probable serine hydrolase isoform X4 n=1 Tax=Microplitis demolitor TaxID=69319 RepID=UPI0004CD1523|nr:probable serine hydrolase isoform X4 [Microplitis demolitor]